MNRYLYLQSLLLLSFLFSSSPALASAQPSSNKISCEQFCQTGLLALSRPFLTTDDTDPSNNSTANPSQKTHKKPVIESSSEGFSPRVGYLLTSGLYFGGLGILLPLSLSSAFEGVTHGSFDGLLATMSGLAIAVFGFVGSVFWSEKKHITHGQVALLNAGMLHSLWMTFLLSALTSNLWLWRGSRGPSLGFGLFAIGTSVGYFGSMMLGKVLKPTPGSVTLSSYTSAFFALYTLVFASLNPSAFTSGTPWVLGTLLAVTNLGFAVGWWIHKHHPITPFRTALLGLGGFLGGLLGALIGFASSDPVVIGTLGVLVSIAGIAFTWMLTNNMPHENASSALSVGALLNYRKKTWSLGMPIPALAPQMRVGGEIDWQVRVPLLKGRW